jgi:hypothetical protein
VGQLKKQNGHIGDFIFNLGFFGDGDLLRLLGRFPNKWLHQFPRLRRDGDDQIFRVMKNHPVPRVPKGANFCRDLIDAHGRNDGATATVLRAFFDFGKCSSN